MRLQPPRPPRQQRWSLDPLHMTLRRQSRLRPASQFAIRMSIMIGMIIFIVAFHWIERDSLKDQIDGHVSFSDVIYFTMSARRPPATATSFLSRTGRGCSMR